MKSKNILRAFLGLTICLALPLLLQAPARAQTWARIYSQTGEALSPGDTMNLGAVESATRDGYYLAGGGHLLKIRNNGDFAWLKYLSNPDIGIDKMLAARDGGVLGMNWNTLTKLDADGNVTWSKWYDFSWGGTTAITWSNEGGYVLSGNQGVVKLDGAGNPLWIKAFFNGANAYPVQFISRSGDGSYYAVAGNWYDPQILFKLGPDYSLQWARVIATSGSLANSYTGGIETFGLAAADTNPATPTTNGCLVFLKASAADGSDEQWLAVKVRSDGTLAWYKFYGFGTTNGDMPKAVSATADDGFILAGGPYIDMNATNQAGAIIKITGNGSISWKKKFEYTPTWYERIHTVVPTSDAGLLFVGHHNPDNSDSNNQLVLKADQNGNIPNCSASIYSNPTVNNNANQTTVSVSSVSLIVQDSALPIATPVVVSAIDDPLNITVIKVTNP